MMTEAQKTQERENFEKLASLNHRLWRAWELDERTDEGGYLSSLVEAEWQAWLARAEQEEARLAQLPQAWRKYVQLFGEPPHGSEKQLSALLELLPSEIEHNKGEA